MSSLLPEHWPGGWQARPAWDVVASRDEFGGQGQQLSLSVARGVRPREVGEGRAASENTDHYRAVRAGDLVINRLVARDGAISISRLDGLISPAYWVLKPRRSEDDARFIAYQLRSSPYLAEIGRLSKAMPPAQFDLPWDQFRRLPIVLPHAERQREIANYLDTETARINALIAKRKRMRDLVAERRLATITLKTSPRWAIDAVLHARNSTPPGGWSLQSLRDLTDASTPIVYGILLAGPRLDEGVAYLGAGDVRRERMNLEDLPRTTPEIAAAYPRSRIRTGEIVYSIRGTFGNVELVPPELDGANLSRDVARIRPGSGVSGEWLLWALRSELAQEQFRRKEVGTAVTGVNIGDLKKVKLPVPPTEQEQYEIASEVSHDVQKLDSLDDTLARQVALLREHRQRIITAAVTGEFEVPGVAA